MIKYLGIDHGTINIGLAIAESETLLAVPYNVLPGDNPIEALELIQSVCDNEEINEIVIGMPMKKDGGSTAQGELIKEFITALKDQFTGTVHVEDERFSTRMAEKLNPEADDSVAAAIILQGYLDREIRFKQ